MTQQSPQDGSGGAEVGSGVPVEGPGAQAGSQGVTEADMARANEVCIDMPGVDFDDNGESWRAKVAYVAAALAEERAKARAPFLALADVLDVGADNYRQTSARIAVRYTADCIRRAAEDPQ